MSDTKLAPDGKPYLVLVRGGIAPANTPDDEHGESLASQIAIAAAEAREDAERLKVTALPEDANEVQELVVYAERLETDLDRPLNYACPAETIAQEPPFGEGAAVEDEDKQLVGAIRNASLTKATARAKTLRYAQKAGVLEDALSLAEEVKAHGGVERMLAHQMAAAHRSAMVLAGRAVDSTHIPKESAHLAGAAARMMVACQSAAIALQELRKGKRGRMKYTVEKTVYHVRGGASGAREAEIEARPIENQRRRISR